MTQPAIDPTPQPATPSFAAQPAPPPAPSAPAPPALDPEAIKGAVTAAVREVLAAQPPAPAPRHAPAPAPPPGAPDPVAEVIRPYIQGPLQQMGLEVQSASDAATFYAHNPGAAPHAQAIEQIISNWKQRGLYAKREDAFHYLRGSKYDEFRKRDEEERKAAEERANLARTAGAGGVRGSPAGPPTEARTMTDEDLDAVLERLEF